MVGGVIGVLICVWFYQTAIRLKLNPLQWIVAALIIYYGVKFAWTFWLLKPLMGASFKTHTMLTGIMIEVSGSLVGAACAALFRNRAMLRQHASG